MNLINFLFQCNGNSRWHVNVHFIKKKLYFVSVNGRIGRYSITTK